MPSTYATDTFDRADSATGLGTTSDGLFTWAYTTSGAAGAIRISGNTLTCVSNVATETWATIDPGHADCMVQTTFTTGQASGMLARYSDGSNYFLAAYDGYYGRWYVSKVQAGTSSQVITTAVAAHAGQVVRLVCSGSTITLNLDGVDAGSYTSTFNQTATKVGFYNTWSGSGTWDNLLVASPPNPADMGASMSAALTLKAVGPTQASTSVAVSLGAVIKAPTNLGAAAMAVGPTLAATSYAQGTLAYPYPISGVGGTTTTDVSVFTTVATDPAEVVPGDSRSLWLCFTEGEARNFTASLTAAFGVVMELYVGPANAGPDDLTLFDFDGGAPTDLGSVSLDLTATTGVDLFKQLAAAASAEVTMGAILG